MLHPSPVPPLEVGLGVGLDEGVDALGPGETKDRGQNCHENDDELHLVSCVGETEPETVLTWLLYT